MIRPQRGIGFTGTQRGMTDEQRASVRGIVLAHPRSYYRHGDCVGADAEFHKIVREARPNGFIIGHIPDIDTHRAFCNFDSVWAAKPYLERNRDIVDWSDTLVATPKGFTEERRSGTWATVRYAVKRGGRTILVVWPNGRVQNWQ